MKKKEVKISVDKNGKISIEVLNAQGSECLDWTQGLENSLGGEQNKSFKDSYYGSQHNTIKENA